MVDHLNPMHDDGQDDGSMWGGDQLRRLTNILPINPSTMAGAREMPRKAAGLTARQVQTQKAAGLFADGGGLY